MLKQAALRFNDLPMRPHPCILEVGSSIVGPMSNRPLGGRRGQSDASVGHKARVEERTPLPFTTAWTSYGILGLTLGLEPACTRPRHAAGSPSLSKQGA